MHLDVLTWLRWPVEVQKVSIRIEKNDDLSGFDRGMVVGAKCVGLFQKLLISWNWHHPCLEYTENN